VDWSGPCQDGHVKIYIFSTGKNGEASFLSLDPTNRKKTRFTD
jgi:hypothetical protein